MERRKRAERYEKGRHTGREGQADIVLWRAFLRRISALEFSISLTGRDVYESFAEITGTRKLRARVSARERYRERQREDAPPARGGERHRNEEVCVRGFPAGANTEMICRW